jgi:Antirestriction protein
MAPGADRVFEVVAPNGFVGRLSSDALGIAACLYAFSHGSFGEAGDLAESCAVHYHQLREYALQHPAAGSLMAVID